MMLNNNTRLFFIGLCITNFLSFTNAQCKLDSIYRYEYEELKTKSVFYDDTFNNQKIEIQWGLNSMFLVWKPHYKFISTVDSSGNVLTTIKQNFTTSFSNYSKDNWTYDSNGNMTSYVYQVWNTSLGSFINSFKRVYEYDVNNNRVMFLYQNWNFDSGIWENIFQIVSEYDNLFKISELFQNWDEVNEVWQNDTRYLNYLHDANHNVLSEDIQRWRLNDSVWQYDTLSQVNYAYDNNNNIISEYRKYWDSENQTWTNIGGQIQTFAYDEKNNPTYYKNENWDTISSSWQFLSTSNYTNSYDLYNNLISVYRLDSVNGFPGYNNLKAYYYDCNFANVNENNNNLSENELFIFPNPVSEILNIKLSQEDDIMILNNVGKIISHSSSSSIHHIKVSHLTSGVYFIKTGAGLHTTFFKN